MGTLTVELPSQKAQTRFNLRRWGELLKDPDVAKIEGRVETDRHGNILVMSPPPAASHGGYQSVLCRLMWDLLPQGRVLTECPISTADGVRAADVAWASPARLKELGNKPCFPSAPEICVEVLSPRNSKTEIEEKKQLYFDAGAKEVWICSQQGRMTFFTAPAGRAAASSRLCPEFPRLVRLR